MRREGRQRGMIRTFPINLSDPRRPASGRSPASNMIISGPTTAGLFTKAPSKPTNHSKFTGKCARPMCRDCHIHPPCKSKLKAKGAHKLQTSPDHLAMSGASVTVVLDYLDDLQYI